MSSNKAQSKYSEQYILNDIYEVLLHAIGVYSVGWNGQQGEVQTANSLALKYVIDGTDVYVGQAAPGTPLASALWQAFKFTGADGTITWADGDGLFNNVATDLTALSYA